MNARILTLVSVLAIAAGSWMQAAPRRELERYLASVVEPVRAVDDAAPTGDVVIDCETRVLPAYRKALAAAKSFKPGDTELATWAVRFVTMYSRAEAELTTWIDAARAGDHANAEAALIRFAGVRDDQLAVDLEAICRSRGVTPLP